MATVKEIQESLESFGGVDLGITINDVIAGMLRTSGLPNERIEIMVEQIIASESPMYVQALSYINELKTYVKILPDAISGLSANLVSITAAASGPSAAAVPGMKATLQTNVTSLKAQMTKALSLAAMINIDIPGIDPLINAAKILNNFIII